MMRVSTTKVKMVQMGGPEVPAAMHAPLSDWIDTVEAKW